MAPVGESGFPVFGLWIMGLLEGLSPQVFPEDPVPKN